MDDSLLKKTLPGVADQSWWMDQVKNEGPDHKQVHSALLLKTMIRLLTKVEKRTGERFELQPGERLNSLKNERDETRSVVIPAAALSGAKKTEVLETLAGAPDHELIVFSTLLHGMEWLIKSMPEMNIA